MICVALVAAWLLTFRSATWLRSSTHLDGNGVSWDWYEGTMAFTRNCRLTRRPLFQWVHGDPWSYSHYGFCWPRVLLWEPWSRGAQIVVIPFWIPLLLAGLPTTLLWWRDRRRVQPGHCPCGYDLTGNVSGICPECGLKTPAAAGGGARRDGVPTAAGAKTQA